MGYSSFLCSKSNTSIPANGTYFPIEESDVVMVLPDNTTIRGIYDGYGRIGGHEIYAIAAQIVTGNRSTTSDFVFSDKRYIQLGESKFEVHVDDCDEPIDHEDDRIARKSINQLMSEGALTSTNFSLAKEKIKIVKAKYFVPETDTYESLKPSESCPDQGFFWDSVEDARKAVLGI